MVQAIEPGRHTDRRIEEEVLANEVRVRLDRSGEEEVYRHEVWAAPVPPPGVQATETEGWIPVPNYSTDVDAAADLTQELTRRGWRIETRSLSNSPSVERWAATVTSPAGKTTAAEADSSALALCRAILIANEGY